VGRRQLVLTADGAEVQVCQEGANSSTVAGQVLQRGKCQLLKVGQCLDLLEGRHRWWVPRYPVEQQGGEPLLKENGGSSEQIPHDEGRKKCREGEREK